MVTNHKNTTVKIFYTKTIVLAVLVAMFCLLLGAMLLTTFMVSGSLDIKYMDIGGAAVIFFSTLIGSLFLKKIKGEGGGWLIISFSAAVAMLLVLINVTVWGAEFKRVFMKVLPIMLGSAACIVDTKGKRGNRKRYKKR